jgi:conserved hypothethical protein
MNLIRPGMGTENASTLLSVLVQMHRPQTVLEIGAGDSTIALARALADAVSSWAEDRRALDAPEWSERTALLDPSNVPSRYEPFLITIDDFSGEGTSAELAWSRLRTAGIQPNTVKFIKQDFFTIPDDAWKAWGPLDLVWIDAGTPADDIRFVAQTWDKVRPGGYLVLHEPTMLTTVNRSLQTVLETVRSPLWEELSSRVGEDFELITLPESHKYRQSGVGLIRKLPINEQGVRNGSLQRELLALGETPIRNDLLNAGHTTTKSDPSTAIATVLRDACSRRAYAAVLLGAQSIASVADMAKISIKEAGRAISRLLASELLTRADGVLSVSDEPWVSTSSIRQRDRRNLTDSELESPELLSQIVRMFVPGRSYPEATVSKMCAAVSSDYARLRRKLVDDGYLRRSQNHYERT